MRRLLSMIGLALLSFVGLAGPGFFGLSDEPKTLGEPSAPSWSRPVWAGKKMGPPLTLSAGRGGAQSRSFSWTWTSPLRVSLTGTASPDGRVTLVTPRGPFDLAAPDLHSEADRVLDLDARDIAFKKSLGFQPFDNAAARLFSEPGEYALTVTGSADVTLRLEGGRHGWLGTDQRGRDVLALFVGGVRISLIVGLSATLIATLLGLSLGLISGYAGGVTDALIMRTVDVLLSIPTLPILMVLAGLWGHSLWNLVLILSVFSWMGTARTVRAMALSVRDSEWVEGLRALGAKRSYILFRHLVPEALPLLLATVALGVPGAILAEAGVAFLGLSDPLLPSWGRMLHEAHVFGAFTQGAWWLILPPGLGISVICLIFMDLGRRLEERADPRLRDLAGPGAREEGAS